jgi:PAS domain S-box-containing protein
MSSFDLFRSFFPWTVSLAQLRHYTLAFLILLIGTLLSLAVFRFYQVQDEARTQAEFDHLADIRLFYIQTLFERSIQQVDTLKQFYHSSFGEQKNFQEFVHYTLDRFNNFMAIGWLDARATLNSPSKVNFTSFFFPTKQASDPILSLAYLEWNQAIQSVKFEEKDYAPFLNLIQQSRTTPQLLIFKQIHFFANQQEKTGFFILGSVFSNRQWQGTLIGLSDFDTILQSAKKYSEPIGLNVEIYDVTDGNDQILYHSALNLPTSEVNQQQLSLQQKWTRSHFFQMGDRIWKIETSPTLEFFQKHKKQRFWEIPIIGFLISGLSAFYFLVLVNQKILIEQEVKKRTEELATINRMLQQEVHERQRIEEDFTEQQRYLQKRHEALEYLTKFTTSELRNAFNEVILRASSVMQIDRVSIWFYEKTDQVEQLSCAGLYTFTTNSFSNHLKFDTLFFPHYFKALSSSSYLIIPSTQDGELNQELSSYLAAFKIISKLDIPIIFEGKLLGALCCEETRQPREWPLEDRHFGQTIADIIAIMIEQSARRKAEKALQESEERLRFITQKAIDAIISMTEKGEIISWNYGAEQMFGYSELEVLGKSLDLILPDSIINTPDIAPKPIELKGKRSNGIVFPVEMSHTRWKSGTLYFDTVIIRDITERKENEKQLIRAMHEAKAANEAKSTFLTTISHELRTPLNAIIGFDQCLLMEMDGPISEEQKISLHKIEKSSFHLLSLINDILDLAKIEANRMELEIIPQDIAELVTSCVEEIQFLAHQKNLDVQLALETSHVLIEMDKIRIRQVLLNLLSNAVKFTEKGSIKVSLMNHPHSVDIIVTDTGIGLSSTEMAKMFRPFSQADSTITRKYGGTGLGLAISKKIIDLHGGTIEVTSHKGIGSTFTVKLSKTQ